MEKVMLKIVGTQIVDGEETPESKIEFVTEGMYREENGLRYLSYEETELSGLEGCTTDLEIGESHIQMTRHGDQIPMDTIMRFEAGKRYTDSYHTPYGDMGLEILTNSLVDQLRKKTSGEEKSVSGCIHIDYSISLKGLGDSHNKLDIEVM